MNTTEHTTLRPAMPADRAKLEHIESLLARYPGLTDPEIHEVLLFLRKGKVLELGLLSSNEAIKPQLARFRADHARDLAIGKRELAMLGIALLIILAAVAMLWDAGAR